MAVVNSWDLLEIAVRDGSARERLGAGVGAAVSVEPVRLDVDETKSLPETLQWPAPAVHRSRSPTGGAPRRSTDAAPAAARR